ncbi:MAG TPA: flagellar protein FliS [Anaerolineae bacterium]|nr:flagellar protein FliS [Anaerolineae bacterium]HIQ05784.1 flagellar protein FliS [Anaerolineae bacterium]
MQQMMSQQAYQQPRIENTDPLNLVLVAYDAALTGCARHDLVQTARALTVLYNGLDFSQGEIAVGLFRLYQYCAGLVRQGKFDEAADLLRELRETWAEALQRHPKHVAANS